MGLCGVNMHADGTYTVEGITQIAEMLKVNQTLQSIKCAATQNSSQPVSSR